MKFLFSVLERDRDFKDLINSIQKGRLPLGATGLSSIHKALIAGGIYEKTGKKPVLICHDEAAANSLLEDLVQIGFKALLLPQRDLNLVRLTGYSKEYEHKRVDTLSRILDGHFDMLVLSVDSALEYTLPPEVLKENQFTVASGDEVDLSELADKLISAGYTRSDLCEGAGQFSIRGGILDIFPVNQDKPVRIELWGDEVDTISYFDIETQRREEQIEKLLISPACELPVNPQKLGGKLENYIENNKKLDGETLRNLENDIDMLKGGISVSPDLYLPFLYKGGCGTVFDYIKDSPIILCESGNIKERLKSIFTMQSEDMQILLESGVICSDCAKTTLSEGEFYTLCEKAVFADNFPRSSYELNVKDLINFTFKRSTAWSGDISVLCEDIDYNLGRGGSVLVLAGGEKAANVLALGLEEKGYHPLMIKGDEAIKGEGLFISTGGLSSGFEIPALKFMLITHRHISAEKSKKPKRPKNAKEIGSLDELKNGDLVVHVSHGIGIFDGINHITTGGIKKDYIKIKYKGTDVLYVPVTQLDLVSKYIGSAEEGAVKINRLGSQEWQKTKQRVRAAVKNMAKQLTALYAKRMATKGYAFSEDTDLQNDFERRFEYEETPDQLQCIREIKSDMERDIPMDRLLCGDVGFGKTEVALRAAFKCISEGKQCALLVPTTILAMQHYNTIIKRFGDMPVTVKLLSRFVTPAAQKKTVEGLKKGRVDMVVGTHRLISKDVEFKDIGLVIIDEEQRFGVAQKERLKELYPFVDILTLSATPIPRTLNMAMSGLRDMSSIDEAPGDRHPVQTYVLEHNDGVLIDAINKELRRGGQVYYLHNRVESIDLCAAKLKSRIPDARFAVAHGKMSEDELSKVWQELVEHEIDVLVCTTIIETGVDVPNANTLIIENADRMGLSQLHQLRGRVGRSPRRAYAYFCFNRNKQLSDVAGKRLEAIREFTEFGSGFKIAMRDLEIRGAGSILGGEQHGNMEAVGYDMYLKLLSDAVNRENGIEVKETRECTIDLNIPAHIPESYIESLPARLGIYKRIADIESYEDVTDIIDELCDRFGEPPKSVLGLMDIALLRNKAAENGIYEITGTPNSLILHTESLNEETVGKLTDGFKDSFAVTFKDKPRYVIKLKSGEKPQKVVGELVKIL